MKPPSRASLLRFAALVLAAFQISPSPGVAQSGRLWGTSTFQYVQARPLAVDSVLEQAVPGSGLLRSLPEGGTVRCVAGEAYCRFARAGDVVYTVPTVHDVSGTAWGFLPGVRVYGRILLRGEVAGRDGIWPRADDAFDLVLAYAEWNRRLFRIRAGRQWAQSGLGWYNYDGVSVRVRPVAGLEARIYGGWSLARGLNEPRTGPALAAVESFAPDERALIWGVGTSYRPSAQVALSALYQRELRQDRRGLVSERGALDGLYRRGRWSLQGSLEVDLPSRVVNEASARIRLALPGRFTARSWIRRYEPFFELWTIWGAFTPVAFTELGAGGSWSSVTGQVSLSFTGSWRSYGETGASQTFGGARSTAWRIDGTTSVRLTPALLLQGRLGADVGMGAARTLGGTRLEWALADNRYVGLSLEAFQTSYEFRVEDGTVVGAGIDGSLDVGARSSLRAGVMVYHHARDRDGAVPDWSQVRAHLRWAWSLGGDADRPVLEREP